MKIEVIPVGPLHANCYLAYREDREDCVVIDPGDNPQKILLRLSALGKKPAAILLTHGHFDHVSAEREIRAVTGCPVYIHPGDLDLPARLAGGSHDYRDFYPAHLSAAGLEIDIMSTPGHSAGSVCLLTENVIFSGDTLFAGACGRTDLPGGSWAQMSDSLKRLAALPGDYAVYPGHGEATTLEEERKNNPYMR